ncbi:hypothetical protein [Myxococcus llanfairpwllgwyngyllgogerychwyrndrobwllllantysiliogogogochensis]|uniref:hypothetical protein n=1 Tax=Myxococcus llanfairpwllgwyngyllgogerychwyrndrobwllllantysiliogogogochensis TaxID=2590453 RepID=UPI0015EFF62B|nr:hypothetical protein [Myxococcus llanfairpwllgwyngyllgogerychwyrndrobwllllantysiliogogogochensis]
MHALNASGAGPSGPQRSGGSDEDGLETSGPWLSIAGWTVGLQVPDSRVRELLHRSLAGFVSAPPLAGVRVCRLRVAAPSVARPEPTTRELPRPWREQDGSLRLEGEDYSARLDADGLRGEVVGAGRFPVEVVLRVMLAADLARRGGLLVHGVALVHGDGAALFTGHSGAGKSTLGGLWMDAGEALLSDELVAVWPDAMEGSWRAAGTPWNLGFPREARLRAVGTLAWDSSSRWERQRAGDVGRVLVHNALLSEASSEGRGALLASAGRLLTDVEPVRLVFSRDASAATVVREALGVSGHG